MECSNNVFFEGGIFIRKCSEVNSVFFEGIKPLVNIQRIFETGDHN